MTPNFSLSTCLGLDCSIQRVPVRVSHPTEVTGSKSITGPHRKPYRGRRGWIKMNMENTQYHGPCTANLSKPWRAGLQTLSGSEGVEEGLGNHITGFPHVTLRGLQRRRLGSKVYHSFTPDADTFLRPLSSAISHPGLATWARLTCSPQEDHPTDKCDHCVQHQP